MVSTLVPLRLWAAVGEPLVLLPLDRYDRDHLVAGYQLGPTTDVSAAMFTTDGAIFSSIFHCRHRIF